MTESNFLTTIICLISILFLSIFVGMVIETKKDKKKFEDAYWKAFNKDK